MLLASRLQLPAAATDVYCRVGENQRGGTLRRPNRRREQHFLASPKANFGAKSGTRMVHS